MTNKRAAESTYQAVLWVLRTGVARLDDDWMRPRIAQFSSEQLNELVAAMHRLRARYPATVTEDLISKLELLR